MFTINIEYTTGDSFNSNQTEDQVALVWKNKELARKALQAIKEHYEFCTLSDKYGITPRERSEITSRAKLSSWYSKDHPDFTLMVEVDDGSYMQLHAFWCGYFEILHSAEVIVCEDTDTEDKIYFN